MVRSIIPRILALAVAFAALLPMTAAAANAAEYSVYEGNLSGTYTDIARDLMGAVGLDDSYVFFRSGQYDYTLIVGDITYDNGVFTAPEAVEYRIYTGSNYGNSYDYSVTHVTNVSLRPDRHLVYSDLGDFPQLRTWGDLLDLAQVFLLVMYGLVFLVHCIFAFVLRRR